MVAVDGIKSKITLEDFLSFSETKPASEYVNGKVEQKQIPQGEHIAILLELCQKYS